MTFKFSIILARQKSDGGIGLNGKLPWNISEDLKWFEEQTNSSVIIMGKNTWESLPRKPLPKRINIIISTTIKVAQTSATLVASSLNDALEKASKFGKTIFVIGGTQLYKEAWSHVGLERIVLSTIVSKGKPFECDCFLPHITLYGTKVHESKFDGEHASVYFEISVKKQVSDEYQYLKLLKTVLAKQTKIRPDRTGTGTFSMFGPQIEFDLSQGFPLLTTKKMFWTGIVEELLWFLRGETHIKSLQDKGVHIWDANSSRKYLDDHGFKNYPEGELGPSYGHQFRAFGARVDFKGVDQVTEVIKQIKNNPFSRSIIISLWNPVDVSKTVLPPCHILSQYYVSDDKKLSCKLFQRSADLFLGSPFNIASYALFTHMLAHVCDLEVGTLVYSLGDAHIYSNHVTQVKTQLQRAMRPLPRLKIVRTVTNIDSFTMQDFELVKYTPHPTIAAEMSA